MLQFALKRSLSMAVCLVAAGGGSPGALALENQLANHPSPYLALHDQDPVHWQVWGEGAIETAKRENKLLFLSSGYFSCHWCHVMQRESYQNPALARLLNTYFVPVKIDRELRPALDAALIQFVQATRGHAGWPLNVFVTPDGYPVYGMVYLPPAQFAAVLEGLGELWSEREAELRAAAIAGYRRLAIAQSTPRRISGALDAAAHRQRLLRQSFEVADMTAGGFGEQNKFPSTPQLLALLEAFEGDADPLLGEFLHLTLRAMADGGLRDHVGGGFFRYCVDPTWETPHFEKMLYDNALLAQLYLHAASVLNAPEYERVARDTLDSLMRQFRGPDGVFYASLSAVDSEGDEGAYYLWRTVEIETHLGAEEQRVVEAVWGLSGLAPFADGYLPIRQGSNADLARVLGIDQRRLADVLATARSKLLAIRVKRGIPIDTKRLAAWNGLALAAFSTAAEYPNGERYRAVASDIRDYLVEALWNGTELLRAQADGRPQGKAALEDYAYAAWGLLLWSQLEGNDADLGLVRQLVEQAWERFRSPSGWRLAENLLLPIGSAEPLLSDGPMPSPSAVLLETARRLSQLQRDPRLYSRVLDAVRVETDELRRSPFSYASHIALLMRFDQHSDE